MLVSIALTAATVCRRAPAQNVSRRRSGPRPETRPTGPRPRYIAQRPRQAPRPRRDPRRIDSRPRRDRDVEDFDFCPRRDRDETLVRLETVSRPRRLDRDHIPDYNTGKPQKAPLLFGEIGLMLMILL